MADFLLSVGVDTNLSYNQLIKDIGGKGGLIDRLNKSLPKIRLAVELDQTSITQLQTQINSVINSIGSSPAVSTAAAGGTSKSTSSADNTPKVLARNTKEYYDALKRVNTLLSQVTQNQKKWSAARDGKARDAYENLNLYADELRHLISELQTGTLTVDDFKERVASLGSRVASASGEIKDAGENTKTWSERVGGLAKKFAEWFSLTRIIMALYRAMKQMVSAVIEIDTAMTELKKVTNETDARYEQFLDNAIVRAKKLGASVVDVVNTSADFARLGLSIEDSEMVSDAALVYKNVGDGIETIDQASESLISTMQAFGIKADDVMSIVDKFNVTGNKFAISSGGVGDALLNSAAALSAAGNSLDESIGLITAANTTIQNPEKVGTALKTISMYLRAAKTEAEEAGESTEGMATSVSELRDELLNLTGGKVDIQLDDDRFKSTYQILKELSEVWDDLSDISQANITEMIGGKRNANVISALLKDFEIAENVIDKTATSSGSALEENAKVMESIQGHITKLQNTFTAFAVNLFDVGLIKVVLDFATIILEAVNGIVVLVDALGGLPTVLMAVGAALLIAKGGLIAYKIQLLATAAVEKFVAFCSAVKSGFLNIINIIPNAIRALTAYRAHMISTSAAIQASIPVIGLLLAAVTAVAAGMALCSDSTEEMEEQTEDTTTKIQEMARAAYNNSDQIIDLASDYFEASHALSTLTGSIEQYKTARDGLVEGLKIEQTELQKLIDKYGDYDKALAAATVSKLKDEAVDLRAGFDAAANTLTSNPSSPIIGAYGLSAGIVSDGDPRIKEEVIAAITALQNSDVFGGNLGLVGGEERISNVEGTEVHTGYVYFPNNPSNAEVEAYGDTLARALHDYDVYKAALKALNEAGIKSDNIFYKSLQDEYTAVKDDAVKVIELRDALNKNAASQFVFSAVAQGNTPTDQAGFDTWRKQIIDAAAASGQFYGTLDLIKSAVDNVLQQEPQFKGFYKDLANSTNNATVSQKSFAQSMSSVQSLSSGFEQLGKIYADISDKGDFDWGSIVGNEEFTEKFGGLGDAYTDFMKTIANSPDDINACQGAFNNLAKAYIDNSGVLNGLSDETRGVTISMLEQMGVANAAAIVDAQLAYEKERLKYTTGEYADMSYEQIYALYAECEAGSVAQEVLARVAIAKMQTNEAAIKTATDVDQLIKLAQTANITAQSLTNATKARELWAKHDDLMAQAESIDLNSLSGFDHIKGLGQRAYFLMQANKAREEAEELLSNIEYDPIDFGQIINFDGGSAAKSAQGKSKTWFEKQLAAHKHLVAMEQETEAAYLQWLNSAYQQAYKEGIIELDDYYQYQEEVFKGLRDVFQDQLSDIEHEISMREQYEGESDAIIALYEKLMKEVAQELAKARAQGLDDTDDYIQDLQKKWQGYYDSVKEIREEAESGAKDAINDLVDYRLDMIKQEIDDEKDALDKKLDNLKEFYDKQKEMLQDQYDEEKYLDEQAEKRKSVSDLQAELAMLENDDSAWAQKRKLELREELAAAQDDLGKFEDEHALDMALDALENAYDAQEAQIRAEMEALEDVLNDKEALFNRALADIQSNTFNLYQEMLAYNREHGTGNDEDVTDQYEEAYKALLEYQDVYGEAYKGIILPNSTNYKSETGSWKDSQISGTSNNSASTSGTQATASKSSAPSLTKGSTITVKTSATHFGSKSKGAKMSSSVPGGSYTVYQTSGDQVLIGRNGVYTGWIKKSDIVGYAQGTSHATAGLHSLDELGSEYLFTSSDGTNYRVLNSGDKVLNATATDFLYEFANGGGEILEKIIKSAFGTSLFNHIKPAVVHNDIKVGGVTVAGNADSRTVSEIRRAQRDNLTDMLKSLNKLNK